MKAGQTSAGNPDLHSAIALLLVFIVEELVKLLSSKWVLDRILKPLLTRLLKVDYLMMDDLLIDLAAGMAGVVVYGWL